ncbi:alpha/beta hydrolase [Rubrobacter indicoceani]|uniref:alpha/beta hydrolase n=1 Tax=Rubrobacter indicoceani TaxID=2051957 RepID=UPI000E5B6B15|nr:alpha/beta fold hydrolase [Rubrobacter indicoceani]
MSRFVLVHGAFHGGWTWDKVAPILEESGHETDAPDLPGHGSDATPAAQVTMQSYVDRVVESLDASVEPVVLVGHSMAGAVISQAADARPEKVAGLVYLSAFILKDGESIFGVSQADGGSKLAPSLEPNEQEGYATLKSGGLKESLYNDCTDNEVAQVEERLTPQPLAPLATPVSLTGAFANVPRAYIESTDDNAVSLDVQRGMQAEFPCDPVISLDTSHCSYFIKDPEKLAGHLDSIAKGV